jgi:anti-sigma B factor antagonist
MSEPRAVSIQPHAEVVWAIIHPATLDEATIEQMQAEVYAAAAQHAKLPVILDMSNVSFIPSTGLGALVGLMRSLKKEGRRFILVGLQTELRSVFAITHLDKLLEIHTNVEAALNRLRSVT